ncbi:MAG TPA: GtrA family protein [Polyangiaceae bacterium]
MTSGRRATFLKHQAASIFTTVVDFGVMIVMHHFFGVPAVWATGIGASAGAVTNFTLGRLVVFEAQHDKPHGQAVRYAVVSGASLLLNMAGEWLVHEQLGVQYVIARAVVAIAVSVGWNYPMQKNFVFGKKT